MNIQKTFYKIADFVNWAKSGQLVLSPEFQRRSVWKNGAKSYLIDTIIRGMPIPIIFLRDKRTSLSKFEPVREVVDGQQRLRTVLSFVCPEYLEDFKADRDTFTISKNHNPEAANRSFAQLDDAIKERILDYTFDTHILPTQMDNREIIQIFRRMNSTSFSANKQELRNAEFFGAFKTSVYTLAAEQYKRWRDWGVFSEDNISRMQEVELTTECIQLMIACDIAGKSTAKMNKAYADYDADFPHRKNAEQRFRHIMEYIDENYGQTPKNNTFLKKTLFYTFFAFLYSEIYGFASLDAKPAPKVLSPKKIAAIATANQQLKSRTAPQKVLEATDRRTTNPKERRILFDYLAGL